MKKIGPEFLDYIVEKQYQPGDRLPPLFDIGNELSVSVGKLREQLHLARSLGLVSVKPRDGIRVEDYSFTWGVKHSLLFALGLDADYFQYYSDLRVHVEAAFFAEAARLLTPDDHADLLNLIDTANAKLRGEPIHIPHLEHRQLHLSIYKRLDNPFVIGLLEAYWDAYESIELNIYTDYRYLCEVWDYHSRMVQAVVNGQFELGRDIFVEHTRLLRPRVPHHSHEAHSA